MAFARIEPTPGQLRDDEAHRVRLARGERHEAGGGGREEQAGPEGGGAAHAIRPIGDGA